MDFVPMSPAPAKKVTKKEETPKASSVKNSKASKISGAKKKVAKKVAKKEIDELEISKLFEARKEKSRAGVTISKKPASGTFSVPKVHFVNTEKIVKRPLSKNVYPKKVVVPKEVEKPSAPVTIINKPEKDSKMGMVVAIIITIILGAAAGTVAFLLLPN